MSNLDRLQKIVTGWANSISPSRLPKDAVVKLVSEVSELLDAVLNKNRDAVEEELGDCIILLLDLTDMYHLDLVSAGVKKMKINAARSWANEDGVIRRVRNENGTERSTPVVASQTIPDLPHES